MFKQPVISQFRDELVHVPVDEASDLDDGGSDGGGRFTSQPPGRGPDDDIPF